jgi:hypothetical protein
MLIWALMSLLLRVSRFMKYKNKGGTEREADRKTIQLMFGFPAKCSQVGQ